MSIKIYSNSKVIHNFWNFNLKLLFCIVFVLFGTFQGSAQRLSPKFLSYIDKYKDLAIKQCETYGIPAAITIAQGLLESAAGTSKLAVEGNNHFGIKTHNWQGGKILKGGSWYRKYNTVEEGYEDHSRFLLQSRYAKLFTYPITDYKDWAYGLKACGYAESSNYAVLLVKLIETYKLYELDKKIPKEEVHHEKPKVEVVVENIEHDDNSEDEELKDLLRKVYLLHNTHKHWNQYYVEALPGDTYESIAVEFNLKPKDLLKYNDLGSKDKKAKPKEGARVWITEKANQAAGESLYYNVHKGDTLWSVSQLFGIKLSNLLKFNELKADAELSVGQKLKLQP